MAKRTASGDAKEASAAAVIAPTLECKTPVKGGLWCASARPGSFEGLPDEVLALLFRFLDPKTLLMAVPAVSAWGGPARRCPALGSGSGRWAGVLRKSAVDFPCSPPWI